jgi:hypothetical protein
LSGGSSGHHGSSKTFGANTTTVSAMANKQKWDEDEWEKFSKEEERWETHNKEEASRWEK